jgi:hypothetical protein
MRDAERYQKELDTILQETEDKAKRASYLVGVARIEQLFEVAAQLGISQAEAWRIIDRNPNDAKSGLLALIENVQERSK